MYRTSLSESSIQLMIVGLPYLGLLSGVRCNAGTPLSPLYRCGPKTCNQRLRGAYHVTDRFVLRPREGRGKQDFVNMTDQGNAEWSMSKIHNFLIFAGIFLLLTGAGNTMLGSELFAEPRLISACMLGEV